ncbi:YkvA family protein [Marilutibacter alkalisoli]|uniref:DUF1232 domain-containing protein n=1 Tax=Marilutibacter alkalisoli TaxID=2591633 RepID=A0A514BTA7_9GAMM|nr:hypothetical protein [Lysobacter alkalisoli]QDH70641.1 hypothetical protein FKV23_11550 [Lysobacter alkalisoli]
MRRTQLNPLEPPMPFGKDAPPPAARDAVMSWQPAAVAQFDALLHEINPDAPRVDIPRLQAVAEWLVELPEEQARPLLATRLERIELIRTMLADPGWDTDEGTRARVNRLVAYFDREDDLIPDGTPSLGMLDDALMLELAWPMVENEVEQYRDFRDYREQEHPTGDAAAQREAWFRDRLAEIEQLRLNARARSGHYVKNKKEGPLRVF